MGVEHAQNDNEWGKVTCSECTVLLPPGVSPIAVNKYITSKTVPVPFCPSHVSHKLAWGQTTGSLICKKDVQTLQ